MDLDLKISLTEGRKIESVKDIEEARRSLFERTGNMRKDREFVRLAFEKALSNPNILREIKEDPTCLIQSAFTVVDKNKKTLPFFLNEVQKDFLRVFRERGGEKPYFILKGRQQGFTSLITAIQLAYSLVTKNFAGLTVADCGDNSVSIFNDKAKRIYNNLPSLLKPHEKYNSAKELFFDNLNSSWRVAVASEDVGRSRTLNFLHLSEVAFYTVDLGRLQGSLLEATAKGSVVVYETTANGFNDAKALWDSGSCINLFYRWWQTAEYREKDLSYLETKDKWLKTRLEFLKGEGLDDYQLAWYARKYQSYLDKNMLKQEYPCSPEDAFVGSSDCLFDKEELLKRLSESEEKGIRGDFRYLKAYDEFGAPYIWDIRFQEDEKGMIVLHSLPVKERVSGGVKSRGYVMGCDTAGLGEDFFTAKVVDCKTRKTVATLRVKHLDEDLYADQLYCLGKTYNDAFIAVETNYSTLSARQLESLSYPNLFRRERGEGQRQVGFETNLKTRPLIIGNLIALFREDSSIECDKETLREMLTFVRGKNGRGEADKGCHDDLVMALAIAQYVASSWDKEVVEREACEDFLSKHFNYENKQKKLLW